MNDAQARWTARVMGDKPDADTRAQIREFVRLAREAGCDDKLITATIGRWQFDNAAFVEQSRYLPDLIEAMAAAPDQLRADFVDFPIKVQRGVNAGKPVKDRIENTRAMLDGHGAKVRYNLMTHRVEITARTLADVSIERRANVEVDWFRTTCRRYGLSPDASGEQLSLVAREYHPVRDWILSAGSWDGVDRIDRLIDSVETTDATAPMLIRRWIRQCAAAISGGRFRPVGVLTFVGPQGCGKTTWAERLAPPEMDWIGIGLHLDPSSRDSVQAVTRYWIAELGEVDATFRRADVAALKAFIDRPFDTYRSAYARREEQIPRRTCLFASVNKRDFLVDETGNRRWWVVDVTRCRWDHGIDTRQLWAQAFAEVAAGKPWRLDVDESAQLAASNARFESIDPLSAEVFATWSPSPADSDSDSGWTAINDIVAGLPGRADRPIAKREVNAVGRVLRAAGVAERRSPDRARALQFAVRRASTGAGGGERWSRWS